MKTLNSTQIRYLRSQAHHLKVSVTVGTAGLSTEVAREIDQTLEKKELIKVKLPGSGAALRKSTAESTAQAANAELIQCIGRIAVLYRPAAKPRIVLPE